MWGWLPACTHAQSKPVWQPFPKHLQLNMLSPDTRLCRGSYLELRAVRLGDQQLVGLLHKGGVVLARVDEQVPEHLVGQLLVEHGVGVDQREEGLQRSSPLKHRPFSIGAMLCSACRPQHRLQNTGSLSDSLRHLCKHFSADSKDCKQCRQRCVSSLIRYEHHWGYELVGRHLSRDARHMHGGQDWAAWPWKWPAQRRENLSQVQRGTKAEMTHEACMHHWQGGESGQVPGRGRVLGHDAGHALMWLAHFKDNLSQMPRHPRACMAARESGRGAGRGRGGGSLSSEGQSTRAQCRPRRW